MKPEIRYLFAVLPLTLLLSACSAEQGAGNDLMLMSFDVEGVVQNEAGLAIKNITVIAESADSVKTDAAGYFSVHGKGVPAPSTSIRFVDEYDDGVNYVPKTVVIDIEKYKDGEGWTEGYYRNSSAVVVRMSLEVTPAAVSE